MEAAGWSASRISTRPGSSRARLNGSWRRWSATAFNGTVPSPTRATAGPPTKRIWRACLRLVKRIPAAALVQTWLTLPVAPWAQSIRAPAAPAARRARPRSGSVRTIRSFHSSTDYRALSSSASNPNRAISSSGAATVSLPTISRSSSTITGRASRRSFVASI